MAFRACPIGDHTLEVALTYVRMRVTANHTVLSGGDDDSSSSVYGVVGSSTDFGGY